MTDHEADDVLKVLRDELAGVSPSPGFQSRVRQRIGGELDLLREELTAVEPSPAFKARVRQGIEQSRDERAASWFSGWRWLVPAGAAAAIVIVGVLLLRPRTGAPVEIVAVAPVVSPAVIVKPPVRTSQPEPAVGQAARPARVVATSAPVPESRTVSEPSLEVITNQPEVIRAMLARMALGATVVETTTTPLSDTAAEIVVPPIEVSPIVVKSLVDPPAVGGAQPIIRRVTANTAERSDK